MPPARIAAIILAAGASRRLGSPKQLVEVQGETLLARAVRFARQAGAAPVLVVLGAHGERIREAVPFEGAIAVLNGEWQEGIASSIRAGLHAAEELAPGSAGVLLMTCDQPLMTDAHLTALLGAYEGATTPSIVASVYAGVRGVPAVLPRAVFADLQALKGDRGARDLLRNPSCALEEVPFEGGEFEVDLPDDLAPLK